MLIFLPVVCLFFMINPPADGAPSRPLRVLLVDDHEDTNRMLTLLLKRRGYEVRAATSIAEAVAASEGGTWDVLVSDMNLPDGSGVNLLGELPSPPTLGGIVVSGLSSDDDIDRVTAAGYKGYLSKPVDLDKLEAMIRGLAVGKTI